MYVWELRWMGGDADSLGGWGYLYDYGLVYDRYWVGGMVTVVDLGLYGLDGWEGVGVLLYRRYYYGMGLLAVRKGMILII